MPTHIDTRTEDGQVTVLYRWDEYSVDEPEFMIGVVMEHHRRQRRGNDALSVDAGGAATVFPENGREHSVYVTAHGDVYSRLRTDTDDVDAEEGRHTTIVDNKFGALYGRADAAEDMYGLVNAFAGEDRDAVMDVLDGGPYTAEEELYNELIDATDIDEETVESLREAYGNVTDTERRTQGRDIAEYGCDTVQGQEMQEIYDNVVDVVRSQL